MKIKHMIVILIGGLVFGSGILWRDATGLAVGLAIFSFYKSIAKAIDREDQA